LEEKTGPPTISGSQTCSMAVHSRFNQAFKPDLKPDYLGYPDDKEILEDEMQAYMIEGNCSLAARSCVLILSADASL